MNYSMLAFSWQAFLMDDTGERTKGFADWVDCGLPPPRLSEWAEYLQWITERFDIHIDQRRICRIDTRDGKWVVDVVGENPNNGLANVTSIPGDGLVITGPGPARKAGNQKDSGNRVTDAQNFWLNRRGIRNRIDRDAKKRAKIGVIGDGGAAASAIMTLLDDMSPLCQIKVISPSGVIYSRGESYDENRHHSDPADWMRMDCESRKKFVQHTSNGVFSLHAKSLINDAENLETLSGKVASIEGNSVRVRVTFEDIDPSTGEERAPERFDYVIVAMGFDAMWWSHPKILGAGAKNAIEAAIKKCSDAPKKCNGKPENKGRITFDSLAKTVGCYLEVSGMAPKLYLPMMAAHHQGPGFPGLGCLGLLSDRILADYCGEGLDDPPACA
ncbi:hypothetical protein [Streptomyces sp. NPDC023838]|uniref:hypothetical protein n=1 Tax=Streptomyces sp. NPDC023838 TaxID=3154325 RepID=UPI0033F0431A